MAWSGAQPHGLGMSSYLSAETPGQHEGGGIRPGLPRKRDFVRSRRLGGCGEGGWYGFGKQCGHRPPEGEEVHVGEATLGRGASLVGGCCSGLDGVDQWGTLAWLSPGPGQDSSQ